MRPFTLKPGQPRPLHALVLGGGPQTGVSRFCAALSRGYYEDHMINCTIETFSFLGTVYITDPSKVYDESVVTQKVWTVDGSRFEPQNLAHFLLNWQDMTTEELNSFWESEKPGCRINHGRPPREFLTELDYIFLLYRVDDTSSLVSICNYWVPLLRKSLFEHIPVFLVGNKRDLRPQIANTFTSYFSPPMPDFTPILHQVKDAICSRLPLEDLVILMQTCTILRDFIKANLHCFFETNLLASQYVTILQGKFAAHQIGAKHWAECDSRRHEGYRSENGTEKEEWQRLLEENERVYGVTGRGATTSPVPEVDRIWSQALRLLYPTQKLNIMKYD